MNILITGANGFIGKYITDQLAVEENLILAFSYKKEAADILKDNVKWVYGDLGKLEHSKVRIVEFNPDVVIHLAWQGIPDFSENISRLNLNNSIRFLDFILEKTMCKKVIVSGSCFEYGNKNGEVKELDKISINSYFTWAKTSLFNYLELKCAQKGVQLLWFRFFYVYGLGQRKESLIPMIIESLKKSLTPDIRNPYNKNDFIYVKDIANAIILAVYLKKNIDSGIYNLGSGYSTSVLEICQKIELILTGKNNISNILLNNPKNEYSNFWSDSSKARNTLGWEPEYNMTSGLKDILK